MATTPTDDKLTRPRVGQNLGSWTVFRVTRKRVVIGMVDSARLGSRFAGRRYTFSWDGTGFKRQGEYLRADGIS
jgi:hypothetical protein